MNLRIAPLAATVISLVFLAPAFGVAKVNSKTRVEKAHAKPPEVKRLVFDPDHVEASRKGPGGSVVVAIKRVKHSLLFRVRPHFIPELIKSAEDI